LKLPSRLPACSFTNDSLPRSFLIACSLLGLELERVGGSCGCTRLIHTAGIVFAHASILTCLTSVGISLATVDRPVPLDGSANEYAASFAIISFAYERNPIETKEPRMARSRVQVCTRIRIGSRGRTEGKGECTMHRLCRHALSTRRARRRYVPFDPTKTVATSRRYQSDILPATELSMNYRAASIEPHGEVSPGSSMDLIRQIFRGVKG